MKRAIPISLALLGVLVLLGGCRAKVQFHPVQVDTTRTGKFTYLEIRLQTPYHYCEGSFNASEDSAIAVVMGRFEEIRILDSIRLALSHPKNRRQKRKASRLPGIEAHTWED